MSSKLSSQVELFDFGGQVAYYQAQKGIPGNTLWQAKCRLSF